MRRIFQLAFYAFVAVQFLTPDPCVGAENHLFGPERFRRKMWTAETHYTRTFPVSTPGMARLVARGGFFGSAIKARITLNGKVISGGEKSPFLRVPLHVPVEVLQSNTLEVSLSGGLWPSLTVAIVKPNGASVEILEPVEGITVEGRETAVHGRVSGMTASWGVSVNGQPALVWEDRFSATNVPLHEGENTLMAVATDKDGRKADAALTIFARTAVEGFSVTPSPESGLAPLETTLWIESSGPITTTTLLHTGPGEAEILDKDSHSFRMRIEETGIHHFTVNTLSEDGKDFSATGTVLVMAKEDFDAMIGESWEGMKTALLNGDTSTAASYFDESTRDLYREIFETLKDDLPRVTGEMGEMERVSMEDNMARYRIRKERVYGGKPLTVTYWVYFIKDKSGLWKIHRY